MRFISQYQGDWVSAAKSIQALPMRNNLTICVSALKKTVLHLNITFGKYVEILLNPYILYKAVLYILYSNYIVICANILKH